MVFCSLKKMDQTLFQNGATIMLTVTCNLTSSSLSNLKVPAAMEKCVCAKVINHPVYREEYGEQGSPTRCPLHSDRFLQGQLINRYHLLKRFHLSNQFSTLRLFDTKWREMFPHMKIETVRSIFAPSVLIWAARIELDLRCYYEDLSKIRETATAETVRRHKIRNEKLQFLAAEVEGMDDAMMMKYLFDPAWIIEATKSSHPLPPALDLVDSRRGYQWWIRRRRREEFHEHPLAGTLHTEQDWGHIWVEF